MRQLDQIDQSIVERLLTLLRDDGDHAAPHHRMLRWDALLAIRRAAAMRGGLEGNAMAQACVDDLATLEGR